MLYGLILLPALPHLHEPRILAYNTWAVLLLFAASVALRPVLEYADTRWGHSWLRLVTFTFAACLLMGSLTSVLTALLAFGSRAFRWSDWSLSGVQCAMVLFLWATLYLSVKRWQRGPGEIALDEQPALSPPNAERVLPERAAYPQRFLTRVGSRIQIVQPDEVLWVAAARDYAELHTRNSVHLLRETLTSLEKKLDPALFLRIHRSRIVRVDQIAEMVLMNNSEYRLKLRDGSEHRSSRTYAASLGNWMHSGAQENL